MAYGWRTVLAAAVVAAATVLPVGASAPSSPVVVEEGTCQAGSVGRFADCKSGFFSWDIRQTNGGEVIGTADISFTISQTVSPTTREWTAHYAVFVANLTGVAETGTTLAVVPECGGSCSAGSGLPDDGAVLTRNQSVTGEVSFVSRNSGEETSTQTINLYLFNPAAQTPGTTYGDPQTTLGPVRCDDGVPGEEASEPPVPGCVLADQTPVFVIGSSEYSGAPVPAHSAFVAAAQRDPRTLGYGRPGSGRPLLREYLADDRAKQAKRRQVCGTSFKRNPSSAGTPRSERDSCDEYPYSASRQGVPQYAITGHVPLQQNTNAGNRLSVFFQRYHVADGDPFYVQP